MMKYYLMAPGPSMIPERILLEMSKPIIHHRTKAFESVIEIVRGQLKSVFQTKNDIVVLASVGSGGMEAALVNCFSAGDKVIAVNGGKFGERWSTQARKFGLNVVDLEVPWGEAVQIEKFSEVLAKNSDAKGVLCQACETSTGVSHPVQEMGEILKKKPSTLFLVDAITALGISDIKTDLWGLDVVVTGSQKAFMLPPGLAMVSMSDKAWAFNEKAGLPRFYFDFKEELKNLQKNQTHFTPAISLLQGLKIALEMMHEETLPKLFNRHKRLAYATREAMKAIGLELFSKSPADSITAVLSPPGIDGEKLVNLLSSKYNVTIIGGQDHVKGKIFRLGHMGYCGDFDVISLVAATEMALADLGYKNQVGEAAAKATEILHKGLI